MDGKYYGFDFDRVGVKAHEEYNSPKLIIKIPGSITNRIIRTDNPDPHSWVNKIMDMMSNFKQAIQVGNNVTDIMKLPCVFSCHKESDGRLCYLLYSWDQYGNYVEARKGDWICEEEGGGWTVLTDKDYKKWRQSKKSKQS